VGCRKNISTERIAGAKTCNIEKAGLRHDEKFRTTGQKGL
jgi:hypothetical protein